MTKTKWWKGQRGEWYVVAQTGLIALLAFGPPSWPGAPALSASDAEWGRWPGALLMLAGIGLCLAAALNLGRNLTPLPHPKDDAELTTHGAYRLVRHPIYGGLIIAAFGWALWRDGLLTLGYALLLFAFFDIKSRREERWLMDKFPGYAHYRQRVRKLIPFIY